MIWFIYLLINIYFKKLSFPKINVVGETPLYVDYMQW